MINASSIATMKDGVRILNFARGELVETSDLLEALDEKKVAVYVTDFAADEMLCHKGVVALPHLGASTPESEDNCAKMAVEELQTYLETGNIVHSVNLPQVSLPKSTPCRICVIHKNVSGVINKLSSVLAEDGLNIENMVNASKKDYAYSIFDVAQAVGDDLVGKLNAIPDAGFINPVHLFQNQSRNVKLFRLFALLFWNRKERVAIWKGLRYNG